MASKGRDGDTELVHMTKGEIRGLQGLALAHGGSLSINPDTGLVEASFLKRILPMVAGAGLMMIPGVNAAVAAGMVGGFETLRTGDIGKGLMAGLGAYGGAGLAGNLSSAAGSTIADESARNLANQAIADGSTTAGMAEATRNTATPTLSSIGQGTKNIFTTPGAATTFAKDNLMNIGAAAAPAIGDMLTPKGPAVPGMPEEDPRYAGSPYRYNLAPGFQGSTPNRPNPYYRPTGLGYAEGGDVAMAAGGSYEDEPMGDTPGMADGGIAAYAAGGLKMGEGIARDTDSDTASLNAFDAAKKRMSKINKSANMPKNYAAKIPEVRGLGELAMAQGGSLGSYSDGGRMLKGPGDGMSDDIPAMIGKKQPARLADGEFVVPADVVSHLGNGSTDAGAKKLYSMMDKVRTARTGKKKQAPAVKGDKYLPKFAEGGDVSAAAPATVDAPAFSYAGNDMSLADISALGSLISRGNPVQAQAPAQNQPQGFSNADLTARLAAANTNRPVYTSTPQTPTKTGIDYSNIRPDTLINPAAAGWEIETRYSRGGTDDSMYSGLGIPYQRMTTPLRQSEDNLHRYTDSQGNIWIRKA